MPARKNLLREKLKVPGLAEKMRLVGGDAVNHHGALMLLVRVSDELKIFLHAFQAKQAQTLGEASGEQGMLVIAEPDARFLVDQALELAKQG